MNEDGNTRVMKRYVALDIHKHYCVIAGVDREGQGAAPAGACGARRSGRVAKEEFGSTRSGGH